MTWRLTLRRRVAPLLALPLVVAVTAAAPAGNDDGPYLPRTSLPDAITILPPPPAPGSAAARADQAVFAATRALAGSARWRIATDDVTNAPLDRFACAIGVQLDAHRAPALARLLDRIGTGDLVGPVKAHYAVRRPYLGGEAPICEPRTAHLAANGDYPSGHAANGWLEGLVLAQLLPGRAGPILARARSYGESRVVCGSHSVSAVQAGWQAAAIAFALLQSRPAFRRDLAAARAELARLAPAAPRPDSGQCAAETATLAQRPW